MVRRRHLVLDDAMHMGERIRFYREQAGLSQEQLAFEVNVSRATIYRIEAGNSQSNIAVLEHIAEVLEVSLSDLLML